MKRVFFSSIAILVAFSCARGEVERASERLRLEPQALGFGEVVVGGASTRELRVRNLGRAQAEVVLANLPEGFVAEPAEFWVGPGKERTVAVTFSPTQPGSFAGEARVSSKATGKALPLELEGRGVEKALEVSEVVEFGRVVVGRVGIQTLALANRTDGELDYALSLEDEGPFFLDPPDVEGPIEPRGTHVRRLRFQPTERGPAEGTLQLRPCPRCPQQTIQLRGLGAAFVLDVEPEAVDFGRIPLGMVVRRELRVTNPGDDAVTLAVPVWHPLGPRPSFTLEGLENPMRLEPGESLAFELSFAPRERVREERGLRVYDPEEKLLFEVPVAGSGGGPLLKLRPERVDFGLVPLGWPAQEAIVVVNVGDEEEVHVVGVRIEGGGREAFSVEAGELPARVDGEGWEAVLRVEAAAVGRQEAEVVIETDSLVQPELRLPVFADAVGPTQCRLALDRDEIFFGSVLAPKDWLGTETYRLVRSVRVKNEGSSPCLLWDVRIEGDAADHYELLASLPPAFQLEGGEELELPVRIHVGEAAFEEPLLAELTVRWGGVEEQPLRIPVRGMKYPSYPFWGNEPLGLPFDPTPVGAAIVWRSPRLIGGRVEVHLSPDTPPDFVFPNLHYLYYIGPEYFELAFAPTREGTISGQLQFVVDRDIYPYLWDIEAVGLPACEGDCDWPSAFCGEDVELQAGEVYEYSDPTWPHECNWRLFDFVRTPASFYGGAHYEHSWRSRLPAESYPGSSFPKDKHLLLPVAQKACHGWFRAHAVGTYELGNLRVRPDGRGAYCSRTIRATPPPGLWIELQAPGIHRKDFGILYGTAPPWESESWRVAGFGCLRSDFPYEEPCPIGGADAEGTARLPELRTSMTIHVDNPQRSGLPYYFGMEYSSLPAPPEEPIQIQVRVYCDGELAGTASLVLGLDVFTVLGEVRFFEGGGCTFTPDGQTTW